MVYRHTPVRWLYEPDHYLAGRGRAAHWAVHALQSSLIKWDRRAAGSAHWYLVKSRLIQQWVRRVYGIEAGVLPPPNTIMSRSRR
jgi:hypothetical protein